MQELINELIKTINGASRTLSPDVVYYAVKEVFMQADNAYRIFQQQQEYEKQQQLNKDNKEEE